MARCNYTKMHGRPVALNITRNCPTSWQLVQHQNTTHHTQTLQWNM